MWIALTQLLRVHSASTFLTLPADLEEDATGLMGEVVSNVDFDYHLLPGLPQRSRNVHANSSLSPAGLMSPAWLIRPVYGSVDYRSLHRHRTDGVGPSAATASADVIGDGFNIFADTWRLWVMASCSCTVGHQEQWPYPHVAAVTVHEPTEHALEHRCVFCVCPHVSCRLRVCARSAHGP